MLLALKVALSLSQISEDSIAICKEFELEETLAPSASAQVSYPMILDCKSYSHIFKSTMRFLHAFFPMNKPRGKVIALPSLWLSLQWLLSR